MNLLCFRGKDQVFDDFHLYLFSTVGFRFFFVIPTSSFQNALWHFFISRGMLKAPLRSPYHRPSIGLSNHFLLYSLASLDSWDFLDLVIPLGSRRGLRVFKADHWLFQFSRFLISLARRAFFIFLLFVNKFSWWLLNSSFRTLSFISWGLLNN